VFFWTPPHFWSLALVFDGDYRRVGLPMLTIVRGVDHTLSQILVYSLATAAVGFGPMLFGAGLIYGAIAAVTGFLFVLKATAARRRKTTVAIRGLFRFSIVYLLALLSGLIIDRLWRFL
jgi:protoheme IX farnesyltransferase